MREDNRTLGDLIPADQDLVTAKESDTVAEVADLMWKGDYSQIPLEAPDGSTKYVVTWKSIARGFIFKADAEAVNDFSEEASPLPKDMPVGEATKIIANLGYVLVAEGEELVGIVTYTDVMMGK